jgi:hypothetical protein
VCGHAADLGQQRREAGVALEEVLDRDVERAWVRVLLPDGLADHRRVGREGARVVGDQQRTARSGHVLHALHFGAKPVAIEELHNGGVEGALDALGAAPVVEPPVGLQAGKVALEGRRGHERGPTGALALGL